MAKNEYKNISPLGELEIPALGIVVPLDETFEVPDDMVEYFDRQPGNFEPVGREAGGQDKGPGELKGKALAAALAAYQLDTSGTADQKRARVAAAIEALEHVREPAPETDPDADLAAGDNSNDEEPLA